MQKETRGGSDGRSLAAWRCDMQAAWRAHIRDNAPPFPYSDKLAQAAGIGLSKPHPAVPWRGSTRERELSQKKRICDAKAWCVPYAFTKKVFYKCLKQKLCCTSRVLSLLYCLPKRLKGTVSRDFLLLVLFMNQFPPSPRVFHYDRFKFFQKFAEIFAAQGLPPVSTTPVANGKNLQSEKS